MELGPNVKGKPIKITSKYVRAKAFAGSSLHAHFIGIGFCWYYQILFQNSYIFNTIHQDLGSDKRISQYYPCEGLGAWLSLSLDCSAVQGPVVPILNIRPSRNSQYWTYVRPKVVNIRPESNADCTSSFCGRCTCTICPPVSYGSLVVTLQNKTFNYILY